jgi:hypothetical protein
VKIFNSHRIKIKVIILLLLIIFPSIYIFPPEKNIERKSFDLKIIEPRLLKLISMSELGIILHNTLEKCKIENRNAQIQITDVNSLYVTFFSEIKKMMKIVYVFYLRIKMKDK